MESQISYRKWIALFFAIVFSILIMLSGIAYIVDPYFRFRVRDNTYIQSELFVCSGLIDNYEYDTLILGSSMTQNFDMDSFREKLDVKPLHIGIGGATFLEINELINLAYGTGKADQFYICVDLSSFTSDSGESRIPPYLLKDDPISKLQYLLSYEPWFSYIPVDICFLMLDRAGVSLPPKFEYAKSIDKLGNWTLDYTFGEDIVLQRYKNDEFAVSEVDTADLYNRMTKHIDGYLEGFDFSKGEHNFFFPPYSSLFWCDAEDSGYFDYYLQAKKYFVERASEYGATVYDFQCAEFTMDLNNYKDTTHYSPEINDWMVDCFANNSYIITEEDMNEFQEILIQNTAAFREKYWDVLNMI
ncbi:MAG: hypothetical protein K1W34_13065 [Lachnospiraceae bacterium]